MPFLRSSCHRCKGRFHYCRGREWTPRNSNECTLARTAILFLRLYFPLSFAPYCTQKETLIKTPATRDSDGISQFKVALRYAQFTLAPAYTKAQCVKGVRGAPRTQYGTASGHRREGTSKRTRRLNFKALECSSSAINLLVGCNLSIPPYHELCPAD